MRREEPLAVGQVGLGGAGDLVHHPHRLDRVLADRGLLGEHHRVGAVVDRVGDVGHLGPGRAPRGHHRGQHLGRRDRRLGALAGGADQPLLHDRHLRQRQLDPEVAAGDHDPAGRRRDDLLGVLGRLLLLDLGDQRDVGAERAQPLGDRLEVGGGGDEGDREQVDAVLDRELDPAEVAVGRGRRC